VRIFKDNLEIKYFYNTETQKHYIHGKCRDTVIIQKTELRYPVIQLKKKATLKQRLADDAWKYLVGVILGLLVFVFRR
jgi:hypothetical protein